MKIKKTLRTQFQSATERKMVSLLTIIKQPPCVVWWNRFCVGKQEAEDSNHTSWRTQNVTRTEQISQTLNKYKIHGKNTGEICMSSLSISCRTKIKDESNLPSYLLGYSSLHSSLLPCCTYRIDLRTKKQGLTDATHMYQPLITPLSKFDHSDFPPNVWIQRF